MLRCCRHMNMKRVLSPLHFSLLQSSVFFQQLHEVFLQLPIRCCSQLNNWSWKILQLRYDCKWEWSDHKHSSTRFTICFCAYAGYNNKITKSNKTIYSSSYVWAKLYYSFPSFRQYLEVSYYTDDAMNTNDGLLPTQPKSKAQQIAEQSVLRKTAKLPNR